MSEEDKKTAGSEEEKEIEFSAEENSDWDEGSDSAALVAKIKKLQQKLKVAEAERSEYLAGWQRAKADYLNLKKTEERERQELKRFAKTDLLLELIDLADSFDLAFANQEAWEGVAENWRKGVEYIYQQLKTIFRNHGVEEINPIGEAFDPASAQSIGTITTSRPEEENTVLAVVKKGYKMSDIIIRPAHVKIGQLAAKD